MATMLCLSLISLGTELSGEGGFPSLSVSSLFLVNYLFKASASVQCESRAKLQKVHYPSLKGMEQLTYITGRWITMYYHEGLWL